MTKEVRTSVLLLPYKFAPDYLELSCFWFQCVQEFKYSFEVQAVAQRWIEAVIKEPFPTGVTFAEALKSGVILCK